MPRADDYREEEPSEYDRALKTAKETLLERGWEWDVYAAMAADTAGDFLRLRDASFDDVAACYYRMLIR